MAKCFFTCRQHEGQAGISMVVSQAVIDISASHSEVVAQEIYRRVQEYLEIPADKMMVVDGGRAAGTRVGGTSSLEKT